MPIATSAGSQRLCAVQNGLLASATTYHFETYSQKTARRPLQRRKRSCRLFRTDGFVQQRTILPGGCTWSPSAIFSPTMHKCDLGCSYLNPKWITYIPYWSAKLYDCTTVVADDCMTIRGSRRRCNQRYVFQHLPQSLLRRKSLEPSSSICSLDDCYAMFK
jgi:hypothetical protein